MKAQKLKGEVKAPLLLTEGAGSIEQQANSARFRGLYGRSDTGYESSNPLAFHADPNNADDSALGVIPRHITHQGGLPRKAVGCLEVTRDAVPIRCYREGDWSRYVAHILYTDRASFRRAWRAARMLRLTRKNKPAKFTGDDLAGVWLSVPDLMPVRLIGGAE